MDVKQEEVCDETSNGENEFPTVKEEILEPKNEGSDSPSKLTSSPVKEENIEPEIVTKIESLKTLGPFLVQQDNTQNVLFVSDIPQICKDEPCMLGVDEAGRGPVLGPMVYGIAFCPIEKSEILTTLGCADSKQLTEEKREVIFDELHSKEYASTNIGWAVEVISPNTISTNMLKRSKTSLNEVSMNSAIGLIQRAIDLGVNIAEVYVDTVGPPEKYQDKLSKIFPDFQITVAKKADSTYPIVSAASICAKVSRDHAIKVWKFGEGLQVKSFGSGYPGDPVTKAFLQDNIDPVFGFPRLVRFSWSTAEKILQQKSYFVEFDDVDDDTVAKKKTKNPITTFFKSGGKRTRHGFFKNRFLQNVVEF